MTSQLKVENGSRPIETCPLEFMKDMTSKLSLMGILPDTELTLYLVTAVDPCWCGLKWEGRFWKVGVTCNEDPRDRHPSYTEVHKAIRLPQEKAEIIESCLTGGFRPYQRLKPSFSIEALWEAQIDGETLLFWLEEYIRGQNPRSPFRRGFDANGFALRPHYSSYRKMPKKIRRVQNNDFTELREDIETLRFMLQHGNAPNSWKGKAWAHLAGREDKIRNAIESTRDKLLHGSQYSQYCSAGRIPRWSILKDLRKPEPGWETRHKSATEVVARFNQWWSLRSQWLGERRKLTSMWE